MPAVLTVHVVRQGGHGYYVGDLVAGRAQGTGVAGEEPGRWSGHGAVVMGLAGTVEAPVFAEVLEGRHPGSGVVLRRHTGARSVAGYDLTFAAPKSVSILHVLGPREIGTEVGLGHRAAVAEATSYLDRSGVGVRRSHQGQVALLASTGAVAGGFLHRTSRALDPHLHTHVVMANVAEGVDGAWSSVDGRRVFAHVPAARGLYHARLRLELRQRLGTAWEVPSSGLGDVVGVAPGLRRLFSQRSASMDEFDMGRFGRVRPPGLRGGTFHATRPAKDTTRTVEDLMSEWKGRAADFGYDLGELSRVVGLGVGRGDAPAQAPVVDVDRVRTQLGRVSEQRTTVSRRDMVAVVAHASVSGATAAMVESIAARITEAAGPPMGDRGRSGTGDGRDQAPGPAPRWSTESVIQAVANDAGLAAEVVRGEAEVVRAHAGRSTAGWFDQERSAGSRDRTMVVERPVPSLPDLGR